MLAVNDSIVKIIILFCVYVYTLRSMELLSIGSDVISSTPDAEGSSQELIRSTPEQDQVNSLCSFVCSSSKGLLQLEY